MARFVLWETTLIVPHGSTLAQLRTGEFWVNSKKVACALPRIESVVEYGKLDAALVSRVPDGRILYPMLFQSE